MRKKNVDLEALKSQFPSPIQRRVELRRSGQEWKALCPFHQEKTASFTLSESADGTYLWNCFGCNQGGSLIDFLMRFEDCSVAEAIRIAAEEMRLLPSSKNSPTSGKAEDRKEVSFSEDQVEKFEGFLADAIRSQPGCEIAQFLEQRGVSLETAQRLRFGLRNDRHFGCGQKCQQCGERPAIVIPSFYKRELLGVKYRALNPPDSQHKWSQERGSKTDFLQYADLLEGTLENVFATEGPLDAATLISRGRSAVAVASSSGEPKIRRRVFSIRSSLSKSTLVTFCAWAIKPKMAGRQ